MYHRFTGGHPLVVHFGATTDLTPLTVNDVMVESQWRGCPEYKAAKETFAITRHLGVPIRTATGGLKCFAIGRSGRDFTRRDREAARELQPLLTRLDRHLTQLALATNEIPVTQPAQILTSREQVVLSLLGQGLSNPEIARRLTISVHTATKHQENLYRKLDANTRLTAVIRAQTLGLLQAPGTSPA